MGTTTDAANLNLNSADLAAARAMAAGTFSDIAASGFTTLGTGAPSIKMKKLTGTTSGSQGGAIGIAHGLTPSKIIGFTVKVLSGATAFAQETSTPPAFQYSVYQDATQFVITNSAANSSGILGVAVTILVWYEA